MKGTAHRDEREGPVALVTETAHGPRIDAVNPAASAVGARADMRLADARMLHPALQAVPSDHMGDENALEQMTLAARRWGPWTMADRPDGILLDASGAAHLFGGEHAMLAEIEACFAAQGYDCRTAVAPTAGAAWALSHHGPPRTVLLGSDAIIDALSPLPSAALRLEEDTLLLLTRLGLKRIGDLAAVPRESLARRFRNRRSAEANPLLRLDQLCGRLPEPMVPLVDNPPAQADRRLMEPLLHLDLLKVVIRDLSLDLARTLEAKGEGARRLSLLLWRVDGEMFERRVEMASPSRDPVHIAALFDERLDGIDAGLGLDQMRLVAIWAEPLDKTQARLDGAEDGSTDLPRLIDRLTTRLGAEAVRRPVPVASHLPERAQRWRSASATAPAMQYDLGFYLRPLKLLDHAEPITVIYATPEGLPRRFRWRGGLHDIVKAEGPERIAPEWWRERSTVRLRDYYRIEDGSGRRYWIFRNGIVGDGRGGIPDWYLHGLFA